MKMLKSKKGTKKGIMFTIVSVLVCALIITSFFSFQSISLDSNVENTKLRIKGIDRFANDADSYVGAIAYVSGKTTLDFTLDLMIGNNSYLTDYSKEFRSCMLTGNMSVPWNVTGKIKCPEKSYIVGKFSSFENLSNNNLNFKSKITLNNVSIKQEDPWNLIVYVNYTLVINDTYAFWNETRIVKRAISLDGLRDPVYAIVNNSELNPSREKNHTIKLAKVTMWATIPSTAHQVVIDGGYIVWNGAPSYLERLEGVKNASNMYNFSGTNGISCTTGVGRCGIVSIVSAYGMQTYSIDHTKIRSSLDFEFWNNVSVQNNYTYARYDFWKISVSAIERANYNVTDLNANKGLNGSIMPGSLRNSINMNDDSYLSLVN